MSVAKKGFMRDLPVALTREDLAAVAVKIGRLSKQRGEMVSQMKQIQSQWKDRIAGVDAQIHDLAQRAEEGVEPRPIECRELLDYRRGEASVVRIDTGEVLEVRPLAAEERQPSLSLTVDTPVFNDRGDDADDDDDDDDADLPPGAEIDDPEGVASGKKS